jgi:hypothetical protein
MTDSHPVLAARPFPLDDDPLARDPYVRLLRSHCTDPALMTGGADEAARRQRELLGPFLDFFLRHDQDGYYRRLYRRKGLLDGDQVRRDVALADLAGLRIHSDDLRGPGGQRRRLIGEVAASYETCQVFRSSGTSGHPAGPVTIARSPRMGRLKCYLTGQQFEWAAGHSLAGAVALVWVAPQMRASVGLASNVPDAFESAGARVTLGARLTSDDPDVPVWQRLAPDEDAMRAFFAARAQRKIAMITPPTLARIITDPGLIRRISPDGADYLDFGEGGVLITGGGLKRVTRFATVADLLTDARRVLRARRHGDLVPVPVSDGLGFTESTTILPSRAGNPADESARVKVPYPLTWVGLLESAQRLDLVPPRELGRDRLLMFVNFTCLDYLEAIVPGDIVARQHSPDGPGYVYRRRASAGEGFAIREGCG